MNNEIRKSNDTLEATLYTPTADGGWEKREISQFVPLGKVEPEYIDAEDSVDVWLDVAGSTYDPFDRDVKGYSDSLDTLPYEG